MQFAFILPFVSACSEYNKFTELAVSDVFYQADPGVVDILLVVDNSGSMRPYQVQLSENFEAFITFFIEGNVDYRIGVATTSVLEQSASGWSCSQSDIDAIPAPGELVGNTIIDSTTENASDIFSEIVNVGTCGSGYEMGLEGAIRVLENPDNALLREEAYLSVIFVSDEQDSSPLGVNSYLNRMRAVKESTVRDIFNASSLIVQDLELCDPELYEWATVGTRYIDVAEQANGLVENICGDDFTAIVNNLSLISSRFNDIYYLSKKPDLSTLILGIDGQEIPCTSEEYIWRYTLVDDNIPIIQFDRTTLPLPSARITVQYNPGAGNPSDFCNDVSGQSE